MEDRKTQRMRKYGESKTARIMMATVPHVTSGSGLRKFQADGFLFDRVYVPAVLTLQIYLSFVFCIIVSLKMYFHKYHCILWNGETAFCAA